MSILVFIAAIAVFLFFASLTEAGQTFIDLQKNKKIVENYNKEKAFGSSTQQQKQTSFNDVDKDFYNSGK